MSTMTLARVPWKSFLGGIVGIALGLAMTAIAGESPVHVFQVLVKSAFGSWFDFGMTLFYSTPLILTGLSVAIAFRCGLFNIGAEGQLTMGALSVAAFGALFPSVPWPLAPVLGAMSAFAGGALWGAIPGWLKAKRGSHEVINTIMLNFVAAGLSSWVTLYLLKNPDTQNPETMPVGEGYRLAHSTLFGDAPVSLALVLALLVAVAVSVFLNKTVLGFEIRAVGQSETVAETAGVHVGRARVLAMALAGGLAGLVGVAEVLGNSGKFKMGFSPDYGFVGIAVALLGRSRPLGVVTAAFLFGALHKGATDLDFETENVTRDVALLFQALVIMAISADHAWDRLWKRVRGIHD